MTIDLTDDDIEDILKSLGGPYDDRKGRTGQGRMVLIEKLVAAKRVKAYNPSVSEDRG